MLFIPRMHACDGPLKITIYHVISLPSWNKAFTTFTTIRMNLKERNTPAQEDFLRRSSHLAQDENRSLLYYTSPREDLLFASLMFQDDLVLFSNPCYLYQITTNLEACTTRWKVIYITNPISLGINRLRCRQYTTALRSCRSNVWIMFTSSIYFIRLNEFA